MTYSNGIIDPSSDAALASKIQAAILSNSLQREILLNQLKSDRVEVNQTVHSLQAMKSKNAIKMSIMIKAVADDIQSIHQPKLHVDDNKLFLTQNHNGHSILSSIPLEQNKFKEIEPQAPLIFDTVDDIKEYLSSNELDLDSINQLAPSFEELEGTILTSKSYTSLSEEVLEDCNTGLDKQLIDEMWQRHLQNLEKQTLIQEKPKIEPYDLIEQTSNFLNDLGISSESIETKSDILNELNSLSFNHPELTKQIAPLTDELREHFSVSNHVPPLRLNFSAMQEQQNNQETKKPISYDLSKVQTGSKVSALVAGDHLKAAYPKSTKDAQIVIGVVQRVNLKKDKSLSSLTIKPIGSNQNIKIDPNVNRVKQLYKSQNFDSRELHFPLKGKSYQELKPEMQKLLFGNKTSLITEIKNHRMGETPYDARFQLGRDKQTGLPKLYEFKKQKELVISDTIGNHEMTPDIKDKLMKGETVLLEQLKFNKNNNSAKANDTYLEVDKSTNTIAFLNKKAINIPTQIHGVSLSDQQKKDLSVGKKITITGIESKDNKTKFDASLKVSPAVGRFKYDKTNIQKIEKKQDQEKKQEVKQEQKTKRSQGRRM